MSQRDTASRALRAVTEISKDTQRRAKLKTLCIKTPALLQQSGLAQSVVFLRSREVGDQIGETYVRHLVCTMGSEGVENTEQLQRRALDESDLSSYIALTNEAQNAAAWLRRFAQIELHAVNAAESDEHA